MQKIAIAMDGNGVAAHFGKSMRFQIAYIHDGKIRGKEIIRDDYMNGETIAYLNKRDIKVVIAGGMGELSQNAFKKAGIDVIVGAEGYVDDVIDTYLKGDLQSTGEVCKRHLYEKDHKCRCSHKTFKE